MEVKHHSVEFDVGTLMETELPFMRAFYHEHETMNKDLQDLFAFPNKNKDSMPFFHFSQDECDHIYYVMQDYSMMMEEALRKMFKSTDFHLHVRKYFDCEMIRKHGTMFAEYARYTWNDKHPSMYGRFDVVFDPSGKKVLGVYEFNGDTPVMLFESTVLQNNLSTQVNGDSERQFNDWWCHATTQNNSQFGEVSAVFCDTNFVEDTTTCEVMSQVISTLNPFGHCSLLDIRHLDFDHMNIEKPWVIKDTNQYLDNIFILMPWEEMILNFPEGFSNWHRWAGNVLFHEPAWRWFLSHKGMMAYITELMAHDNDFRTRWSHLPILRAYMSPSRFIEENVPYVSKPVVGRLSMNIEIRDGSGELMGNSDGPYSYETRIYQEYLPPKETEEGKNFILGVWLAPRVPNNQTPPEPVTLCVREFESPILKISNERFVPHIIVD